MKAPAMVPPDVVHRLRGFIEGRQLAAGGALLDEYRSHFAEIRPDQPGACSALACLSQWLDVGYEDSGLLSNLLSRFRSGVRQNLPLSEYIQLRLAEGLDAMRREELHDALGHFDTAAALSSELEDPRAAANAMFWKARCLRKAAEYDQALEVTRAAIELALKGGMHYLAAVIRSMESWLLFQKGETKPAILILQEAESILRNTDDFITLGNIQSTYGRIALREGRYDHAMQYFDASIDLFKRRPSLEAYLARSLTNIAQAKRFLALQLRRNLDARREKRLSGGTNGSSSQTGGKAGQLERMHELLRNAQADLAQADAIYRRRGNYHGGGNVDVSLAQIHLDLGDLEQAAERAKEAFELAAAKADLLVMCRARMVEAMVANARFEEQVGEEDDPSRFAQLAHDCAKEAVALAERTESRRVLAQAFLCQGNTLVNGFFNDSETARACCDRAENCLGHDRHDALWHEIDLLRARILRAGIEDPNLRAWSQGAVGDKSLQQVVEQFEELLIRRVWEHEGRKVARVAQRLSVSPKKVRRALRRLGLMVEQTDGSAVAENPEAQ
jgi:tetratricopeptide (TPR) repeat protein